MVYTVSMYIQMSALILFYVGGGGGLTVGCRRKKEGVRAKLKKNQSAVDVLQYI